MAKYKEVKFEVKDEVGIITIDRPERRNALCRDVWASIGQILSDTWDNINVRVIILTGNDEEYKGGRAFSAGLDIK